MRACDVVIGEYLKLKEPSSRYGYLKAVGIILANQSHSVDLKYVKYTKVPYTTIICEHTAFSKTDTMGLIKRVRPRDLVKEK